MPQNKSPKNPKLVSLDLEVNGMPSNFLFRVEQGFSDFRATIRKKNS